MISLVLDILPLAGLLKVKFKVDTVVISEGLHAEVLGEGAAAVREHAGVLLVLAARLELDPVRHCGQELLGQGEDSLVLS